MEMMLGLLPDLFPSLPTTPQEQVHDLIQRKRRMSASLRPPSMPTLHQQHAKAKDDDVNVDQRNGTTMIGKSLSSFSTPAFCIHLPTVKRNCIAMLRRAKVRLMMMR